MWSMVCLVRSTRCARTSIRHASVLCQVASRWNVCHLSLRAARARWSSWRSSVCRACYVAHARHILPPGIALSRPPAPAPAARLPHGQPSGYRVMPCQEVAALARAASASLAPRLWATLGRSGGGRYGGGTAHGGAQLVSGAAAGRRHCSPQASRQAALL